MANGFGDRWAAITPHLYWSRERDSNPRKKLCRLPQQSLPSRLRVLVEQTGVEPVSSECFLKPYPKSKPFLPHDSNMEKAGCGLRQLSSDRSYDALSTRLKEVTDFTLPWLEVPVMLA